jgi:hypothetical protein
MDLVYDSQAELSITAPPIWEATRVSNIQVHREMIHIVPLGENQHTPTSRKQHIH